MRRIECLKYADCLGEAAVKNKSVWSCDECGDYEWRDPTEKEEPINTKEKGEEATIMETKVCTTCGKEKTIDEYNKNPYGKYGRKSKCRSCEADYFQEYKVRKAKGTVKPYKSVLRKRATENAKKAVKKTKAAHTSEDIYNTGTDDEVKQVHVVMAPETDTKHGQAELVRATEEKPDKIREVLALRRAVDLLISCGCLSEAKLKAAMELAGE